MLKKLVNLLFEEEEIEEMDEEMDSIEPIIEVRTRKTEVELPKKAEPVTLKEPQKQPQEAEKPEEVNPVVLKEEKKEEKPVENKGIMIDLEPQKPAKVSVPKFTQKRETEYEFSQIISPIYGVLEDDKKAVNALASPSQPKRKVVPNSSLLGTVISPIYGVTRDNRSTAAKSVLKEEEVENVSLDDLLHKPEPKSEHWYDHGSVLREDDPNDLDSLIRSLSENEPVKTGVHKIVESQLNLFGDDE